MVSLRLFLCGLIFCGIISSLPLRVFAEEGKEKTTQANLFDLPTDSLVQRYLSDINPDSIRDAMQGLQDFGTRFLLAPNRDTVAEWIKNRFLLIGMTDVVIDSFFCFTRWPSDTITLQRNVVATLQGSQYPDKVYIIGGHYDSYSSGDPMQIAPGANDNASGTAGVLEIARVMMKNGFRPKSTIKFIAFAAEELMGSGSSGGYHYADSAKAINMDIELMINMDMIAYTAEALINSTITIYGFPSSNNWINGTEQAVRRYSLLTPFNYIGYHSSDSQPFAEAGYQTISFVENVNDYLAYYHTPQDLISNCRLDYCAEVLKTPFTLLLKASGAPSEVKSFFATDMGNGSSVKTTWLSNTDTGLRGYNIYLGTNSLQYDTSFFTTDSSLILENLLEDTTYFVGIAAEDSAGNESFIVEQTVVPYVIPLPPSQVCSDPFWHKVKLTWAPNKEYDLLGYNVYRSDAPGGTYSKLNTYLIQDSLYIDSTATTLANSYYILRAVDSTLLESIAGTPLRTRPVSLDQGILVVDETKAGDGSPMNPTDTQVDIFYQNLLTNFNFHEYDFESEGKIAIDDLGAYSTIVWHGNQYGDTLAVKNNIQALRKYLEYGGKLLLSCYSPGREFGYNSNLSKDYYAGEFIYDFLKIKHSENKVFSRFYEASPSIGGYIPMQVDTTKTQASTNFHLQNIEGIQAAPDAIEIYRYETLYDTTVLAGKMKGQPVGIEYLGSDFKVVVISFPLFFMEEESAKDFVYYVLTDRFMESTGVGPDKNCIPEKFTLYQNFPNPFNPSTSIRFEIPVKSNVTLTVFDLLGRKIAEIINGQRAAGVHVEQWTANVSSGVYFCRLEAVPVGHAAHRFIQVRKMLFLR